MVFYKVRNLLEKIQYRPPSSQQYSIEEKGLLWNKKCVVSKWGKDIMEFKSRGEAEEFINKEREERIRRFSRNLGKE